MQAAEVPGIDYRYVASMDHPQSAIKPVTFLSGKSAPEARAK